MDIDAHPPKWPHTLNWPWSPTKHSDDSTHADPELFVGPEVVITEKLDGGNTALYRGEVYARSVISPSRDGWMGLVRKHHAWKTVNHPYLVLNGEDLMGIHSIEYDLMLESETFYLFGARSPEGEEGAETGWFHQSWDKTVEIAEALNLQTVPVLFRGRFDSVEAITAWFDTNLKQPSAIGGKDREGFVIRQAGAIFDYEDCPGWERDAAKYIRPHHVATDSHWRENWQPCKLKDPT